MDVLEQVLQRVDQQLDAAVDRLFELLRIQSISTDPAYSGQCMLAADWLVRALSELGFDARLCPTQGHPMVLAHSNKTSNRADALFYGHYDVQPVDPLELWRAPPFEPRLENADGRQIIFGRGSSDDKGQLMTFVEACRAWLDVAGALPVTITVLFEGEEESGSPSLHPFLDEHGKELDARIALICDTAMWDRNTPAISTSLRGLVGEEVEISAANRDLHSGHYGSAAANPNHVLARILADLHDDNGAVTLPGFYDGVADPPAEVLESWKGLGMGAAEFLGPVGLSVPAGEKGRTVLEQTWSRPTAEINGMSGGYTGTGFKTVIPAKAGAKVSFRLVPGQEPEKIRRAFREFVTARLPADCQAEFTAHAGGPALEVDLERPEVKKAADALEREWGAPAAMIAMGGSIPIAVDFKNRLGIDSLLIGFAHADDGIHSPNEKYDLESFHRGIRSWARILGALA
jgi:acetylornithine deacetylase/succinyl-diaminopimelate desuccinylase-like protein